MQLKHNWFIILWLEELCTDNFKIAFLRNLDFFFCIVK